MAQSLQRHLDLPDVQRAITTVVLIQTLFRHLYGTALSSLPTHANSLGMLAMMAEGGGATSTNHAVAAVVPLLLLPQALGEELTQRLQVKLLQQGQVFWSQVLECSGVLQPRQNLVEDLLWSRDALKCLFEGQIICIVIAHIFDEQGACQRIEALQRRVGKSQAERLHQYAPFGECHWDLMATQGVEKVEEHTQRASCSRR